MGLWYANQGHCFESLTCNVRFAVAKTKQNSKSKDHLKSTERRFEIWKEGDMNELYDDGKAIQCRLKSDEGSNDIVKISKQM